MLELVSIQHVGRSMDLVSVHSVSPCKPPRLFGLLLSFWKVFFFFSFFWLVGWLVGFCLFCFRKFNPMEEIRVKKNNLHVYLFLNIQNQKYISRLNHLNPNLKYQSNILSSINT
uniref:Uncharacterized protein n=1 Tax=Mus musculus TaxID=10090 RepID=Q3U1N4_MOUSE|nr:unnamed protein product [Mus musculus]